MAVKVVLGVDAGGSKTTAALAHDGEIVRVAHGPAANATTIGVDDAADAMLRAMRDAARGEHPSAIYVGAAGAGRAAVARELETLLGSGYPKATIRVGDDVAIALRAAIPSGPGIVLVAGTGSVALANDGVRMHRIGGLGYLLGDEGSAAWIGLQAMRLLGRVYDGRANPDETSALAARHLDAPDRDALLRVAYDDDVDVAQIAALAPSIVAFASKGNRESTKIVQDAAKELGDLIKAAARAAQLLDSPAVALSGGLLRENSLLTFLLETRIVGDLPGARILRGGDPVEGAVRCALEL